MMAKVLLTSTAPPNDPARKYPYDELNRMKQSAQCDKFGEHSLTDSPERADIILFVENCDTIRHYFEVRSHPYFKEYREKCFLFSKYDHPLPFLPGVYPSIERRWYDGQRTRSGGYLTPFAKDFIEYDPEPEEPEYLYSFLGAAGNHLLREKILALDYEDQHLYDTSQLWPYGDLASTTKETFHQHYVDVSRHSSFILCPRGFGASSERLFESMRMGRAPVIIADDWVPPEGPDWEAFSLRLAEKQVDNLPAILENNAHRAEDMGRIARETYEDWFSVEATFHRVVEWCLTIIRERKLPENVLRYRALIQLLRPLHFKVLLRMMLPRHLVRQLASTS